MTSLLEEQELPGLELDRNTPVTAQVHAHLRRLILKLHLKPGEALSEKDLSVKLGISRTPVREAFIRLAEEGLVDIFPQRGTLVAPFRIAEVEEAHFIRRVLEFSIVRRAAEKPDSDLFERLEQNLRWQKVAHEENDYDTFMALDETFHRLLCEGVGLPRAWRVISAVKGQLDRVRYSILPDPGQSNRAYSQHVAIFERIRAGDAEGAEEEMRAHLDRIWESIRTLMRDNQEYFNS